VVVTVPELAVKTVPGTKPVPVKTTETVPPANAWFGEALVITGTGLSNVSVYEVETMGLAVVVAVMVTLGFAGMT
jgi:hypothetical protein